MNIEWKDVVGYEGIYEVSNTGEVRTKEGKITHTERHGNRYWKQRILKQKTDKGGYKRVSLWVDGKECTWLVHRIVANSFIPKENGKIIINHKDGNPSNNFVDNIEWCNYYENNKHAIESGLNKHETHKIKLEDGLGNVYLFNIKMETVRFLGKHKGYLTRRNGDNVAISKDGKVYNYFVL